MPIIPSGDYSFQNERILPPDDYDGRAGYQNRTNVSLQVTGPAEYISSKLNPPLITEMNPLFSARVINNISRLDAKYFSATIDSEHVICAFNQASNEVYFTSAKPLKNGKHTAVLHFSNPDGSSRMLYWSFTSNTDPPEIQIVMWNDEEKFALVVFNRDIEPDLLHDSSRWRFNAEQDILRENVGTVGNNMAFLPLKDVAFEKYTNRTALTVSFIDKNGIADYVVNRGGSARKGQSVPCGDCSGIEITFPLAEHKFLEAGAEKYALAYEVTNPLECSIIMEWEGWARVPIANDDPAGIPGNNNCDLYDLVIDTKCEGIGETQSSGVPYPESFSMEFNNGTLKTISFSRNYAHHIEISFWADCTDELRYDRDEHEYKLGEESIDFSESFDCKHPVFDYNPTVLWGDEAADQIESLMDGIPMRGEPVSGDIYCNTMYRDDPAEYDFNEMMQDLRDHNCDLFIVAQASDPISGNRRGNLAPSQITLDMKKNDGTCSYDISWSGGEMLTGVLVLDYKPWGSPEYGYVDDLELLTYPDDWPDPNYPVDTPGNIWHDWCPEESTIMVCNLTDILTAPSGDEITGIKVRITDNTRDPVDGYHGNWRRSEDVMEQVCLVPIRSGSRNAAGKFCGYDTKAAFIENNPYDKVPSDKPTDPHPEDHLKRLHYGGKTDDNNTAFISLRDNDGSAFLDYYIAIQVTDPTVIENFADEIDMVFYSSETSIPNGMEDLNFTYPGHVAAVETKAKRCHPLPSGVTDPVKKRIFDLLFGDGMQRNECLLYHVQLEVSDSKRTTSSDTNPVLYVSSSDHKWGTDWLAKRDFAKSFDSGSNLLTINGFRFGSEDNIRGTGRNYAKEYEDKKKNSWYSYDEFITSGGIETVYAKIVDDDYKPSLFFEEEHCVAVQSESDIILLTSHGVPAGAVGKKFIPPFYSELPYPYWPYYQETHDPASYYSDYGIVIPPDNDGLNAWGFGRCGDFWQKNHRSSNECELRWLTLLACEALTQGPVSGSVNWKQRISFNETDPDDHPYLSSVCGFRKFIKAPNTSISLGIAGDFHHDMAFINKYSANMEELFDPVQNPFPYEPINPCSTQEGEHLWQCPASYDISVSAWMEAACHELNTVSKKKQKGYMKQGLRWAAGIDRMNVDPFEYFYYYLYRYLDPNEKGQKWKFDIRRTEDFISPVKDQPDT